LLAWKTDVLLRDTIYVCFRFKVTEKKLTEKITQTALGKNIRGKKKIAQN